MTIKKTEKHLYDAIDHMLQGLCYWMGYRMACYSAHSFMEAAAVDVALGILNARLDHSSYVVQMEYPYRKMGVPGSKQHADIVILKKTTDRSKEPVPVCVLEFKKAQSANEGIWGDIEKLSSLPNSISRLSILLSKGNPAIIGDFVENTGALNERAKRKVNSPLNKKSIPIKVLFVKKAMASRNSDSLFRAICVELENTPVPNNSLSAMDV